MRRGVVLFLVLVVASSASVAPAQAPARFTFRGSGYGHGLGLSQYGVLGLARQGWPAAKILRHFYTGVKVGRQAPPDPMIRVGLLQNARAVPLEAVSGGFDLLLQSGQIVESVPAGARRTVEITADERFRVVRPDGTVVGDTAWGGRADPLIARPANGRIGVLDWGHVIGRGEVWFEIVAQGAAHVVALVPVEEYLFGVSEVPSSWPDTALRVQAIAGRTYAYWRWPGRRGPGVHATCSPRRETRPTSGGTRRPGPEATDGWRRSGPPTAPW
ncbi:MAG: SpoIID/LytB domain-containing protein [Actinomycetota bacterium]